MSRQTVGRATFFFVLNAHHHVLMGAFSLVVPVSKDGRSIVKKLGCPETVPRLATVEYPWDWHTQIKINHSFFLSLTTTSHLVSLI